MSKLAIDANAKPIQCLRPQTTDVVSVTTSSAQSSAVPANCRVLRLVANVDCFYTVASATATDQDVFLPSGVIEYIHVYEGDRVAVLAATIDGSLYVTEMY